MKDVNVSYVQRLIQFVLVEDYTNGDLTCPQCGTLFARFAMIRGKPANKIIGGKVYMKK